jgi:hypothetical protein
MPADLNCQVKTSKALQVSGERLHEMVSVLSSLSGRRLIMFSVGFLDSLRLRHTGFATSLMS